MKEAIRQKINLWTEKFSEAWLACMVCMVQGDLSVLTWSHAWVASKTGGVAGAVIVIATLVPFLQNRWTILWLTGVATAGVDLIFVPSHFGMWWTEAVCTGAGAMLLALFYERIKNVRVQSKGA